MNHALIFKGFFLKKRRRKKERNDKFMSNKDLSSCLRPFVFEPEFL